VYAFPQMTHDITYCTNYCQRRVNLGMFSKGSGNLNNIELHAGFFKDIFVIEMLNQYGQQNMCILP
jgi:hypothetical protein